MAFDGPVLVMAGPLMAASMTLLISRWQRAAAITGVISTWLLWGMVKAIPLAPTEVERANRLFSGDTLVLLGRPFTMTEGIREFVLFLYLGSSILLLLALFQPQGKLFIPGSLAALSMLAAALMIEPFTMGALLLMIVSTIVAVMIQGTRTGSTRAALRFLIVSALAVPLFLVAGWMLASEQTALFVTSSRLLLGGFVLLMAAFPALIWVKPIMADAPPLAAVFLFGLFQSVIVAFFFNLLQANAWLGRNEQFVGLLFQSGAATMLAAGLLALAARDHSALLAYCLLLDIGTTITAAAIGGTRGWDIAIALQLARFVSLLVAIVGAGILRSDRETGVEGDERTRRYRSIGMALFALGCASLIGLPLTVGFSGRWAIIVASSSAGRTAWLPYVMLLAMIGASIGLLRKLVSMPNFQGDKTDVGRARKVWPTSLAVVILLAGVWIAVFPQSLHGYARALSLWLR